MKKLTAGILASLIGLVSANSADAAVASKKYVDGAIGSLDVAKIENANAEASYIKNITETDGKISAETGELAKVATTGNYNDLTTKLQFVGDPLTGGFVKSVTEANGTVTVVYGTPEDGNTTYTFTDTDTVDFTATPDEKGNVTVTATAKDTTYSFESGNGVTFGEPVKQADGSYKITASVTQYSEGNGISIVDGKISADIARGANVDIVTDAEGKMTISATDTTLNDYEAEGDTGLQVLTRKYNAETLAYEYMWETIDRDYSETQPVQE